MAPGRYTQAAKQGFEVEVEEEEDGSGRGAEVGARGDVGSVSGAAPLAGWVLGRVVWRCVRGARVYVPYIWAHLQSVGGFACMPLNV